MSTVSELDWQELPNKRASRICINYKGSGLLDEEHWDDAIRFLADSLAKRVEVFTFTCRIEGLNYWEATQ